MNRFVTLTALILAPAIASGAHAQQIITAINTDDDAVNLHEDRVSMSAGALVDFTHNGTDVKAITSLGVNKVYASATNGVELSATSAWLDSYTATSSSGAGSVHLTFGFTIDGSANISYDPDFDTPYYSFKVFALRGDGWTLNGIGGSTGGDWYSPAYAGEDYDSLYLERNRPGAPISQFSVKYDGDGFYNYANIGGTPGSFLGKVGYLEDGDVFFRLSDLSGTRLYEYYYADRVRRRLGSGLYSTTYYEDGTAAGMQARAARANFDANYSLLDSATLCGYDTADYEQYLCEGRDYPPTTLTLEFDVLSGSTFSLAAALIVDELKDGTVDLFNTAKLTTVAAIGSDGGTVSLLSGSGQLSARGDGSFGYPAALTAAVPEPASWAMMIGGLGLAGGMMRRRARAGRARPAQA